MQAFLKVRIEIERNYARELQLLSEGLDSKCSSWFDKLTGERPSPDVEQYGTLGSLFKHMHSSTATIAAAHSEIADQLSSEVWSPLAEFDKSSLAKADQLVEQLVLPAKEMNQALRNVDKARERAHRALKSSDHTQRSLEHKVQKDNSYSVSTLLAGETHLQKLARKATEEDNKYRLAIQEATDFQQVYFGTELPNTLDSYQQQVEERYATLSKLFSNYAEISSAAISPTQDANAEITRALSRLDVCADTASLFEQAALNPEELTAQGVHYVPFPGSYWSQPSEDDVGVREGTWEKRSIIAAKRNLGTANPPDFVSTDDVTVMEQQACQDGTRLCAEGEAALAAGDFEKALIKFTRAQEKSRFGNDEMGAATAKRGIESAQQMQGSWSEATALKSEAQALLQAGEYSAAGKKFTEAKSAYEKSGNQAGAKRAEEGYQDTVTRQAAGEQAEALCNEADALVAGGDFEGSAAKYAQAESHFRKAQSTAGLKRAGDGMIETKKIVAARKQAGTQMAKGAAMLENGRFDEALEAFEEAEKKFGEGRDPIGTTTAAEQIAEVSQLSANVQPK
eukprot:TRINITY_DN18093_c0_g1_i1.p1 TRINITY_DN18093_c0_g1~~TRINITY_DN18093_c0_g1_i1.p1  ORF type:complete len:567 (+),score=186.09 TRINITY_DN18093_c0_g1_i1:525-2225(+)